MKKRYYILLFVLFSIKQTNAQTPNWAWAKGGGGHTSTSNGSDIGNNIISDAYGNVYVIGYFQSQQLVIGSYTLSNAPNAGDSADIFIAKYDATGNVIWAKSGTGIGNDNGLGITLDVANNVYITGYFDSPSITFDTKTLTKTSAEGMEDIFIVKYSTAGNIIWANSYGGTNDDFGNGITTDAANNVCITGSFKSQNFAIGTYTLTNDSSGISNLFIAKYDSSGNVLFAKSIGKGATNVFTGSNLKTDANNDIYVTGSFGSTKMIIGNDTLINKGSYDIFIVKYNSSGNPLWARSAGGTGEDEANSMAIDGSGNTYITGYFQSQPLTVGSFTMSTATPAFDILIAKYDVSGNVSWAKNLGASCTPSSLFAPCITTDISGNVYVAGGFLNQNPLFVIGNDTLFNVNPGQNDVFIAKYNSSGNPIWGKTSSGPCYDWDQIGAVTADSYGNIYAIGFTDSDTIVFGSDTLINLNHYYYYRAADYFIAKLGNEGVGIKQYLNNNAQIRVYPNPSNGNITIANISNIDEIKITDILGQIVYEAKPNAANTTLTLNNTGVYFINVSTGAETSTKKIIINK